MVLLLCGCSTRYNIIVVTFIGQNLPEFTHIMKFVCFLLTFVVWYVVTPAVTDFMFLLNRMKSGIVRGTILPLIFESWFSGLLQCVGSQVCYKVLGTHAYFISG